MDSQKNCYISALEDILQDFIKYRKSKNTPISNKPYEIGMGWPHNKNMYAFFPEDEPINYTEAEQIEPIQNFQQNNLICLDEFSEHLALSKKQDFTNCFNSDDWNRYRNLMLLIEYLIISSFFSSNSNCTSL